MSEEVNGPSIGEERNLSFQFLQAASVLILTVILCVISGFCTKNFFSWDNLVYNLLTNAACLGIIACGMTFVMIGGGFDLSVGASTAVCSVVAVLVLRQFATSGIGVAIPAAIIGAATAGMLLGIFNGTMVSYVGVNPFVTTLSTMLVFRGIALLLTSGGQTIMVPLELKKTFEELYWAKVPIFGSEAYQLTVPILVMIGAFAVSIYVLRFTRFGHYVYAVGGNENAAWLAGINTKLVKMATYGICGLACGIAAVIFTAMSSTAQASSYIGLEFEAIASVIVGGTALGGGSGSLLCTINGLLLLQVIGNLLGQFGADEEARKIVRGLIILIVVTIDVLVKRTRSRR